MTTSTVTEDFEGLTPQLFSDYGEAKSITLSGVTFGVDASRRLFFIQAGQYAPTQVISAQQSGTSDEILNVTLPAGGVTSISFDVFICPVVVTLSTGEQFAASAPSFLGITSTVPITHLEINANGGCGTQAVDNFAYGDFTPPDLCASLQALQGRVSDLPLNPGVANSLQAKLRAAGRDLCDADPSNDSHAANNLSAFLHEVSAQAGKKISLPDAVSLSTDAQIIIDLVQ